MKLVLKTTIVHTYMYLSTGF